MNRALLVTLTCVALAACVPEDEAPAPEPVAAKASPILAVRDFQPRPVSYAELTPEERRPYDLAFRTAKDQQMAEIRCQSGGGCSPQGCHSWAVCTDGKVTAVAICTNPGGCTVDVLP